MKFKIFSTQCCRAKHPDSNAANRIALPSKLTEKMSLEGQIFSFSREPVSVIPVHNVTNF